MELLAQVGDVHRALLVNQLADNSTSFGRKHGRSCSPRGKCPLQEPDPIVTETARFVKMLRTNMLMLARSCSILRTQATLQNPHSEFWEIPS